MSDMNLFEALRAATSSDDSAETHCEATCARPFTCPLSRVKAGMAVRITNLSTTPEVATRLREIGFGEKQIIKLLIRQANLICQVCNARLALSAELAQLIIVEPLAPQRVNVN